MASRNVLTVFRASLAGSPVGGSRVSQQSKSKLAIEIANRNLISKLDLKIELTIRTQNRTSFIWLPTQFFELLDHTAGRVENHIALQVFADLDIQIEAQPDAEVAEGSIDQDLVGWMKAEVVLVERQCGLRSLQAVDLHLERASIFRSIGRSKQAPSELLKCQNHVLDVNALFTLVKISVC